MKKHNLLFPRFKVLIDYPDSRYQVGQVITLNNQDASGRHYYEYADYDGLCKVFEIEFANYPKVFKRLKWYEERDIKEMPQYIRFASGLIEKVPMWDISDKGRFYFEMRGHSAIIDDYAFPASEEEYRDFLKQFNK